MQAIFEAARDQGKQKLSAGSVKRQNKDELPPTGIELTRYL